MTDEDLAAARTVARRAAQQWREKGSPTYGLEAVIADYVAPFIAEISVLRSDLDVLTRREAETMASIITVGCKCATSLRLDGCHLAGCPYGEPCPKCAANAAAMTESEQ